MNVVKYQSINRETFPDGMPLFLKITLTMTKRKYNRAYWMGEACHEAAAPETESPDTQVLSMQRQSQHPDFAISDIAKSGGVVQN